MLEDAEKEIYFAPRYHDPHASKKMFDKVDKGVRVHFLDGNPEEISVESRLNAILRTLPDPEPFRSVNRIIRLRLGPATIVNNTNTNTSSTSVIPRFNSFLVTDSNQVIYENINYDNPEEFTVAIAKYDDMYLAEQFINYWRLLSRDSVVPKLLESVGART